VADRVRYESLSGVINDPQAEPGECYDEMLLAHLDELLRVNKGDLLSDREDIQNCDQQSLINAYDNTILYTDYVLSRLIDLLGAQAYPTAMLYVSDHGESLGEKNIYLHGLPLIIAPRQQTQVPMIVWASTQFYKAKGIDQRKLAASRSNPYSHGNLFHSLLGLFDVETAIYEPNLDIFQSARRLAPDEKSSDPVAVSVLNGS
jgi:lipid A ethanolaminephosphotransferase